MTFKRLFPLALLAGLQAPAALASSDMTCQPSWTLIADRLSSCNNLAFLSPGNDSRVNLQLLLDDAGLLQLTREPKALEGYEHGYGLVPFSLGMLDPGRRSEPTPADDKPDPHLDYLDQALQQLGVAREPDDLAAHLFADGEGSRCRSNDLAAMRGFVEALTTTPMLAADEAHDLAHSRRALLGLCEDGEVQPEHILPPAERLKSPAGMAYGRYLNGADAFYRGHFAAAHTHFAALAGSDLPWLRETARYMLGRVALNQAQQNAFDEYGFFAAQEVERASLEAAEQAFWSYLQDYPQGRYSDSARGLMRRIHWLGDDPARYAGEFTWQFARGAGQADLHALIEELDSKLLPSLTPAMIDDPLLLAMFDLIQLRAPDGEQAPRISLEQLEAQRPRFAAQPGLHAYLIAAWHFYRADDAEQALAALPAAGSGPMTSLTFSQQTLRGLALERQGQRAAALQHWQALLARSDDPLQQAQLQLALALNHERSGALEQVFAADSPIHSAPIRERLLTYGAGPALLRQQAGNPQVAPRERATALYTLLYRNLNYADYAAFLDDLARFPIPSGQAADQPDPGLFNWPGSHDAGYACPSLSKVAERLALNAEDAQAVLCLGDFIRVNGLDGHLLDTPPPTNELGGAASQFAGTPYSRLAGYQKLLNAPEAGHDDKAYALFRAINCYAPSGFNGCDDQDIAKEQRQQWFQTLKRHYADTPWAQRLKYYW